MQVSLSQLIDEAWVTPGGTAAGGSYWEKSTPRLLYTPPSIDVTKKGPEDSSTRAKATRFFYDFYAMNLLHMWLGSTFPRDLPPEKRAARQVGAMWGQMQHHPELMSPALFAGYQDVEVPPAGVGIVPQALRDTIERVYDEVTLALGRRLLAHLRLTLIQEFRYLVTHSSEWVAFRNKLIALYKKNNTITKEDLDKAVAANLPGMKGHEDSVKRLLLFAKYYRIDTPTDDPANALKADEPGAKAPEEPEVEPEPEPEDEPEPEPAEPEEPEEPAVEVPPGADWQSKKEAEYQAKIDALKAYMSAKKKLSESVYKDPYYAAGRLTPSVIRAMQNAVRKSGLTWHDVELGYKNIRWGGAMGGGRWGAGVEAYIDLVSKAKDDSVEDMAAIIDHIYDLDHNTGELLNKGGMYVDSHDLDRRAKVTHIARFLPNVSPLVKRLILATLKYVSKHPEIEADIHKITSSPTKPFTPEEGAELAKAKFAKSSAGDSYQTQAPYTNKRGKSVQRNFVAKAHTNGMYSLTDSMDADVKIFDTFEELAKYALDNSDEFIMPQAGMSHYQPIVKQTAKAKYLSSHVRIKLDAEKETALLEQCKMAFRPSETYYKAYLPGDDRFQFWAFSDGTFMGVKKSSPDEIKVSNNWNDAFTHCKTMTANALPNSEYEEGKAWIGKPLGSPPPVVHPSSSPGLSPTVGGVSGAGDQFTFTLAPAEVQLLNMLVQQKLAGQDYEFDVNTASHDGMSTLTLGGKVKFAVGKQAISPTGKKYRIKHYVKPSGNEEEWAFANWNAIYYFINTNFNGLIGDEAIKDTATVSAQVIPTAPQGQLPPHSPSQNSYKLHVGIQKPPTHTIRLTAEDEQELGAVGFQPSMVGTDVWYIHSTAKDTIKFYPNNTAKIIFTSQKSQSPSVTKTIPDAIAWVKQHYTASQAKSPLSLPAQPKSDKGTKVQALFDKIIQDAGFHWDDNLGIYIDPQAHATIKIDPYPKSTVVFQYGDIPPQTFPTLPKLAAYLQGLYLAQKKTLAAALAASKSKGEFPKVAEVTPLLAKKGYTFTGYDNGYVYDNPDGTQIIIQSDGSSKVSSKQGDFNYPTIDLLISYLSPSTAFDYKKNLTDEEVAMIENVVEKFPKFIYYDIPSEEHVGTASNSAFKTRHVLVSRKLPGGWVESVPFCTVGKGDDSAYPFEIRNVDPVKKYSSIYSLQSGLDMLLSSEGGEIPPTPPTTPPSGPTEHQGITPAEFDKIFETLQHNKAGYVFAYDQGSEAQTPYVKIFWKNDKTDQLDHVFSLGALGKDYVFYDEKTKKPFKYIESFDQVLDYLTSLLSQSPSQPPEPSYDTNKLSASQAESIEKLLKNLNATSGQWKWSLNTKEIDEAQQGQSDISNITISNPSAQIWLRIRRKDGMYLVEERENNKWVIGKEFDTFDAMYVYFAQLISNIDTSPQTPEGELPSLLAKFGYEYKHTKAVKTGTKTGQSSHVYQTPEGEHVALLDDGSSVVRYKSGYSPEEKKQYFQLVNFDNIAQLVEFLKEHHKDTPTPSVDEAYNELYNYLEYTGFTTEDKLAIPSEWTKDDGEKIVVNGDGSSDVYPPGHPSHQPAAPAEKLRFETLENLKHYVNQKYFHPKNADDILEQILGHYKFEKQEGSHAGTTEVYLHPASGIMVYTMPNGGGTFKTDHNKVPEAFTSYASTYDLACFITHFFEKYKIAPSEPSEAGMDYTKGTTGDSELDDLIQKAGLIYQGYDSADDAMKWMSPYGKSLKIYDDHSSSFKYDKQAQSIGWSDFEGMKDFLQHHIEGGGVDTFSKNAGYAGLLKTLLNHGFKHKEEIQHQPDEQPYKVFKRPDGAGVTIWDTGVCSYRAASDKAQWEYSKNFAELDDKLKKIYGEQPSDEGQSSIMTYEEAKPLITMLQQKFQVWPKAKKVPTPIVEWQYVSTQPVTGGGGEIHVRDHSGKLAFAIGRRADPEIVTAWYVRQRVMTTVKHITHTFTSAGSLVNWIGDHIDKLLGFQPIYGYEQPGFKGPGTEFGSTYHADLDLETQFHAAGFHQEMNSLGNLWEHESGFTLQLFQKGITWHWEKGSIEYTIDQSKQKAFLSKVLPKISPAIVTSDLVADIFQAEIDKEEGDTYTYEPSGETYKTHDDAPNAESIFLNEHDVELLNLLGFKPKGGTVDPHYQNAHGDIFQFNDVGIADYWEAGDKPETVVQSLRFETIAGALTFAVAKYSYNPFSNANYNENPEDNELEHIEVNEGDAKLLENLGFEWDAKRKMYIKIIGPDDKPVAEAKKKKKEDPAQQELPFDPTSGTYMSPEDAGQYDPPEEDEWYEVFISWNTGNAMWVRTTDPDGIGFNDEGNEMKEGTIKDILIFIWNRWRHVIWQDMGENVPIGMAEPLKDKYNTVAQDKVQKMTTLTPEDAERLKKVGFKFTMDYGYPLYIRGDDENAENFGIVNDGTAHYTNAATHEDKYFKSVEEGIKYLEAKHAPNIAGMGSVFNQKMPDNIHQKVMEKGFNYNEVEKNYQKDMDTDYWEKMNFDGSNYIYTYPYEVTKGNITHKKFASANPHAVLNKFTSVHSFDFKEPIQTWQDAVKFGDANYHNAPADWKKYAPYSPVKSPSSLKAPPAWHKQLEKMGFKYTQTGIYSYHHPNKVDWEAIKIEPSYIVYFFPSKSSEHPMKYFASLAVWPNIIARIRDYREDAGMPLEVATKPATHQVVAQIDKARKQLPKLGFKAEGPKPHHESAEYFSRLMDGPFTRKETVILFPDGSMNFYLYNEDKQKHGDAEWLGTHNYPTINEGLITLAKGTDKIIIKLSQEYEQRIAENGFGWSDEEDGYVYTPPNSQDWWIVLRFFGDGTALAYSMEIDQGTVEPKADKKFENFYNGVNWTSFKQFGGTTASIKGKINMPFSGYDYEGWAEGKGHNPNATIKLMLQDDNTMKIMGFEVEQLPNKSYIYKNTMGDIARFFVNGKGEYTKKGQKPVAGSVKDIMQIIWENLAGGKQTQAPAKTPKKKKTGDVPYTGYDYSEVYTTEEVPPTDSIELLDDDADTMKQMGFLFVENEKETDEYKFYYYNQQTEEQMTFHADGTAEYRVDTDKGMKFNTFETVQEAMQFLWDKHMPHIEESSYKGFMKRLLA